MNEDRQTIENGDAELEWWADRIAAGLPPLGQLQIAAVGRIAAILDARLEDGEPT